MHTNAHIEPLPPLHQTHTHTHTYTHTHKHTHTSIQTHKEHTDRETHKGRNTQAHTDSHTYIHLHIYKCTCRCAYTCIYRNTHTHTHTHTSIYTRMHKIMKTRINLSGKQFFYSEQNPNKHKNLPTFTKGIPSNGTYWDFHMSRVEGLAGLGDWRVPQKLLVCCLW